MGKYWATTGAPKTANGEVPIERAHRIRHQAPSIKAEPRYSQCDLCGWLPAVLVEWPGTRLWLHPDGETRVMEFEAAREAAQAYLDRLTESGDWPEIVRVALCKSERHGGGKP